MKLPRIHNKGFSLVELVVSVAVLGLLMAGILSVFGSSLLSFRHNYAQTNNAKEARNALTYIADELRYAVVVNSTGFTAVGSPPAMYTQSDGINYKVKYRNAWVFRSISRVTTGGKSDVVIQTVGGDATLPTYRFGYGIAEALSFSVIPQSVTLPAAATDKVVVKVDLTMRDTSYSAGKPLTVTASVISPNMAFGDFIPY